MEIQKLIKIVDDYYPKGVSINNIELHNESFLKLITDCQEADLNKKQWTEILYEFKTNLNIEITEFVLLSKFNPSFIAVFLTENYERPKLSNYEPFQLVLKISAIAPVYSLYFDNLVSDWNSRLIRGNPVTKKERIAFDHIRKSMGRNYNNYSYLDISKTFHTLPQLGDVSTSNKRKPYLDECLYGLYLSVHPHNIIVDSKLDCSV
jgi:hypothetical protein